MRRLLLIGLAAVFVPGCFLFHDDYPDEECNVNADCFAVERCDLDAGMCVAEDAAPIPDAPPRPDAPPVPDAGIPDALVK